MGDLTEEGPAGQRQPLSAPAPLGSGHDIAHFDCGNPALNDWLKTRAIRAEARSARTYVVCSGNAVVGYYCLSAGGVLRDEMPAKLRRNMPTSVPVMILGRLAVNQAHQGRAIGSGLLVDAMRRTLSVAKEVGVRAMLVHAVDDDAIRFYVQYGFISLPDGGKTLFLPVETMIAVIPGVASA